MPRKYEKIEKYESEMIELQKKGYTRKAIAEELGLNEIQVKNALYRYNTKQKKISTGIVLKRKGRPPKDYEITEEMKNNELKYIIARKDSKIKQLEMENELMRDFLSLTERK